MFGPSLPTLREHRWALLDALLGDWFPAALGKQGIDSSDITHAERRLGVALPVAFREFYERYGGCTHVWSHQDKLLMPSEWCVEDGGLTFYEENQSVVYWSIWLDEPPMDDPPVILSESFATAWSVEGESMSAFALQLAVQNVKWSESLVACAMVGQAPAAALAVVEGLYQRLPFPDMHWPSFPTRFYGNPELIVETNGSDGIAVSARSREAFDELDALLEDAGVMWDYMK
jgi:hypothetical protein